MNNYKENIKKAIKGYEEFLDACQSSSNSFKLTPLSDETPFALCFAIFGYHLINSKTKINKNLKNWDIQLRINLQNYAKYRLKYQNLHIDKPYLQLLTFTLSSLSILGTLKNSPLENEIMPLLTDNLEKLLNSRNVFQGVPQSGNFAMFVAILLIHAKQYLNNNKYGEMIHKWVYLHMKSMNQFGFWGDGGMNHLKFQNGYHQYEILDYLSINGSHWEKAAASVSKLIDNLGHFAPYPGGGACFDYDAVSLLTAESVLNNYGEILFKTQKTLLNEQNTDGGFCESHYIRPRNLKNIFMIFSHAMSASGSVRLERLRYAITLQRPKHNRIHTHWSSYSRNWSESNLWDSWFRMLTIARIDYIKNKAKIYDWKFINYPGIGYNKLFSENGIS